MTITIINVKIAKPGSFVYCGRRNPTYHLPQSPLANPFKLRNDNPSCRATVLRLYRCWLYKHQKEGDKAVLAELSRLADMAQAGDVALGCWCKQPNREVACHCDVIADFVRREVAGRCARSAVAIGVAEQGRVAIGRK